MKEDKKKRLLNQEAFNFKKGERYFNNVIVIELV